MENSNEKSQVSNCAITKMMKCKECKRMTLIEFSKDQFVPHRNDWMCTQCLRELYTIPNSESEEEIDFEEPESEEELEPEEPQKDNKRKRDYIVLDPSKTDELVDKLYYGQGFNKKIRTLELIYGNDEESINNQLFKEICQELGITYSISKKMTTLSAVVNNCNRKVY
jgi:hypothetical protein